MSVYHFYLRTPDGVSSSRTRSDARARSKINCHGWTAEDWQKLKREATWAGVESSWTRFINHASAAHQNVALCTDSGRRFGRSHAFYAKTDIPAHAELYFSYGAGYWSARGIEPEDPAQE